MDGAGSASDLLANALPYLMGLGATLTLVLLYAGVFLVGRERRALLRRGERVRLRAGPKRPAADDRPALKRETGDQGRGLDRLTQAILPRPERLRARLLQAGLDVRVSAYFLACLLVGAAVASLTVQLLGLPLLAGLLFGVASGVGLPQLALGMLVAKRKQKFISLFPEAIDLVVRGVRSGLPVAETLKMVGSEIGEPVGGAFRAVVEQLAVGKSLDEALWDVASRVGVQEFRFFVIALSVQRETGGNLSETLENLADVLRKRRQTKLKIRALSAEARASAVIIGALPFVLFVTINAINPEYTAPLTGDTRGQIMIAFGLLWLLLGFGMMAKMVRFRI